jgi:mRNA interferase MazF
MAADFLRGRLPVDSRVRPSKLFTAHADLVAAVVGTLHDDARHRVVSAVVQVLQTGGVTEHR